MKKEIKELVGWLEKNNKAELAFRLGYHNTACIDGWIRTESIPSYQLDRVLKIIKGEKLDDNRSRHTG